RAGTGGDGCRAGRRGAGASGGAGGRRGGAGPGAGGPEGEALTVALLRASEPGCVAFSIAPRTDLTVRQWSDYVLVLSDSQSSRRHARFSPVDGGWRVVDLGSTHGTLVNRKKQTDAIITEGDAVQIGNVLLTFLERDDVSGAETLFRDVAATAPRRLEILYR